MTKQRYLKITRRLDQLEQRLVVDAEKRVLDNQLQIKQITKQLLIKKQKADEKYNRKLAHYQKQYEEQQIRVQTKYENELKKVRLEPYFSSENHKKTAQLNTLLEKSLKILKEHHDQKIKKITEIQQRVQEECDWILNDFKKNTQEKLDAIKISELKKLKLARSRLSFLKTYQDQKLELENQLKKCRISSEKLQLKKQISELTFYLYRNEPGQYLPFQVKLKNAHEKLKKKCDQIRERFTEKIKLLRLYSIKDFLNIKIFGCPLYLYLFLFVASIIAIYTKTVKSDIIEGLGLLLIFSMLVGTIFNRLPIWKTYLGGGAVACFLLAGLIGKTFNIIPEDIQMDLRKFFSAESGGNFLNLYIIILLCGALLTMPKKLIATSVGKYGLLVFLTITISGTIGYGFGKALGLSTDQILLRILAPLLGGGNGSGAVPMAQMAQATGYATEGHDKFYGSILIIVVLGNVLMIIVSGLFAPIGKSVKLSGNGKLVRQNIFIPKQDETCNDRHVTLALVLFAAIFILSHTIQQLIRDNTKSHLFRSGLIISQFAWAILFALLLNLSGLVPYKIIQGSKKLSNFFTKEFTLVIMSGIGLGIDFKSLFHNFDTRFLIVAVMTCILLLLVPFLLSPLLGMFSFEAMLAVGACEGAMGGAGAVACLSASKRMELIPYAQITCRIGGSAILIIVSPLFSIFAPH